MRVHYLWKSCIYDEILYAHICTSLIPRPHGRIETAWYRLLVHMRSFPLYYCNVYVDCPRGIIYGQDIPKYTYKAELNCL